MGMVEEEEEVRGSACRGSAEFELEVQETESQTLVTRPTELTTDRGGRVTFGE